MKKYLISVIILSLFSCNNDCNEVTESLNRKITLLKKKNVHLASENKSLLDLKTFYRKECDSFKRENVKLKFEISPCGAFIGEYAASDNNEYKFGIDSIVVYSWDDFSNYLIGKWYLKEDTIKMEFFKSIGKRGVGELLPPPKAIPANYIECYSEYVDFVEISTTKDYLIWSEIKKSLITDFDDSYKLLEYNNDLELSSYVKTNNGNYGEVSFRILEKNDLQKQSKQDLKIMRNEVFARYGYNFKDKELKKYFLEKDWYVGDKEDVDKYLSKIEKANIELILSCEKQ